MNEIYLPPTLNVGSCRVRFDSRSQIVLRMTSPLSNGREEVVDGLIFRPEVAKEFMRIADRRDALFPQEFLN